MRVLPSGSTALLAELDRLEDVLALYTALRDATPAGVVDLVPASRTLLVVIDPAVTDLRAVERTLRHATPGQATPGQATPGQSTPGQSTPGQSTPGQSTPGQLTGGDDLVEIPVVYDGADLADAAGHLGVEPAELVRRHTGERWTVAFCGFAPGFGYLVGERHTWDLPRRPSPRTSVPAGSVALAGEFSGVYPRASPGGWQLIGHTETAVFDLGRDEPALLRPGVRVGFVDVGAR